MQVNNNGQKFGQTLQKMISTNRHEAHDKMLLISSHQGSEN